MKSLSVNAFRLGMISFHTAVFIFRSIGTAMANMNENEQTVNPQLNTEANEDNISHLVDFEETQGTEEVTYTFAFDEGQCAEEYTYSYAFDELEVGMSFANYDDACIYIRKWCDENKMPLVKRDSCRGDAPGVSGRILYQCPHAINRKSKSKGMRKLQSVNFTACKFKVNIYESKKHGDFRVTYCHKNHDGHLVGDFVYGSYPTVRTMSETTKQKVAEFDAVGASRRRIADVISDETGSNQVKGLSRNSIFEPPFGPVLLKDF